MLRGLSVGRIMIPQRLKPVKIALEFGTAKAVPFPYVA
jgi:hypothetical protein